MVESHLYRVWHGTNNDRGEIARFRANDIDAVVDYVKKHFMKPGTEIHLEDGDDQHIYLIINSCKGCEFEISDNEDNEACQYCEISEYVEIVEDDNIEPDFKLIFGTNEFYDLTLPEGHEKKTDWHPKLVSVLRTLEEVKELIEKTNLAKMERWL